MKNSADLKSKLHTALLNQISNQIDTIKKSIQSIHESKSNETKSSAGDKFETGRAMLHLEQDQLEAQLKNASERQLLLNALKSTLPSEKVGIGSLVFTNKGTYYLSIGIGKFVLENQTYLVISADSPIGKLLIGKAEGDHILFNKNNIIITNIS